MSGNGGPGSRWVRHPMGAKIVGSVAIIAPPVAAVGSAFAVSILVPRPPGLGLAWWVAVIGTGIAVFMCGRRLERHAFALAALLGMAIVFPVRPPSRLSVVFTAARLPGPETQPRPATSGNGSGTKQAAVALAGALRAFDERTRREEPVLQRLGLGAVAVSIATIVASVTLGGTATSGRASRSRHGVAGGLAGGPTQPPVASSPATTAAPSPDTTGLAPPALTKPPVLAGPSVPTAPTPTPPVGSPAPVVTSGSEPVQVSNPSSSSFSSAALPTAGAAPQGAGAPTLATATEAAVVVGGGDGATVVGPPSHRASLNVAATLGASLGKGPTLHAALVAGPSLPGNARILRAQTVGDLSVPGNGEAANPSPTSPAGGDAGAQGAGQTGSDDEGATANSASGGGPPTR